MAKSEDKEISYDEAYNELQSIVNELLADKASIDHLYEKVSRAKFLISHCQNKLRNIEELLDK